SELASSHVKRGGKGKGLDRKAARKEKREAVKRSKGEYFSRGKERVGEKRASGEVDTRPAKRPKVEVASGSAVPASNVSKPKPATTSESSQPKSIPTSDSKPVKSASNSKHSKTTTKLTKSTPLSRLLASKPKKRERDVEDDEIAWLEAKLGIAKKKGKKGYGGAFSADGLDDILGDLDRIEVDMTGLGSEDEDLEGDLEGVEDELEGGSDSEESEEGDEDGGNREDEEGREEEEDLGAQSGGNKSGSDEDEESDEQVPTLLEPPEDKEQVAPPPTTRSKGAYVPPHLRQKVDSSTTQTPEQVKLARQIKGLLNRLSEQNIEAIVGEVEALYR
ncbi:suppressor of glycerol defect, partial [Ceratobasidium sp. 423]